MLARRGIVWRCLGQTTVAYAIAVVTSVAAALISLFLDTDSLGTRSIPGDVTLTEVLGAALLGVGSFAAAVVDSFEDRGPSLFGWRLFSYFVATGAGVLAMACGYARFWCERATAVVTGLIDRDHDVLHWSVRAPVADTGRYLNFDHYSREAEGLRIGSEFDVLVDPRGWVDPLALRAADLFYPALTVMIVAYVVLLLLSLLRRPMRDPTPGPTTAPRLAPDNP